MTDKEHAHANGSGYFVNRLRSRIDSIAQKGLLAKPDLKSRWLFMSTLLAD
jgi:hypothetical protein